MPMPDKGNYDLEGGAKYESCCMELMYFYELNIKIEARRDGEHCAKFGQTAGELQISHVAA